MFGVSSCSASQRPPVVTTKSASACCGVGTAPTRFAPLWGIFEEFVAQPRCFCRADQSVSSGMSESRNGNGVTAGCGQKASGS